MRKRNYDDEKANEENKSMRVLTIVGVIVMYGAAIMATLLMKM